MTASTNGSSNGVSSSIPNNGSSKSTKTIWDSQFIEKLPDPTRIFSMLVITIMILRNAYSQNWDFTEVLTYGFILNPYVLTVCFMAIGSVYYGIQTAGNDQTKPLPVYDRWTVEWYWWNSWLYHMTMDGFSGSLRLVPVVVQQYDILDKRFPERHVVPWIIGMIELFVMGPLCMVTLISILQRNNTYRYGLELIVSTLHITGMIVFVVAEVYEGQLCVPALDPVGVPGNRWANLQFFNLYHLTYYWFGFWFCNLLWGVVPLIRIRRSLIECSKVFGSYNSHNNKKIH